MPHLAFHLFHPDTIESMLDRVPSMSAVVAIAVLPVVGLLVERENRS